MSELQSAQKGEGDEHHFLSIPWCAALLKPTDVQTFTTPSYSPPDQVDQSVWHDKLFRNTLKNEDAVPACVGFYRRPSLSTALTERPNSSRLLLDSASLLFDLQPGVNGYQGTVHGGFFAVLMDEAMGSLIHLNYLLHAEAKSKGELPSDVMDLEHVNFFTAGINMKLQKPLPTPNTVLVKATILRLSGSKLVIRTTIEGEELGLQYAMCDGIWVSVPRVRL